MGTRERSFLGEGGRRPEGVLPDKFYGSTKRTHPLIIPWLKRWIWVYLAPQNIYQKIIPKPVL
jgi:hypothetical protein